MTLLDEWIEESIELATPLCFHTEPDSIHRYRPGLVWAHSKDWVGFSEISPSVWFDTHVVLRKANVVRLSRGDNRHDRIPPSLIQSIQDEKPNISLDSLEPVLQYCMTTLRAVRIGDFHDSLTSGFVRSNDDHYVELERYSQELQYEARELIMLKDILFIEFGGPRHHILENLVARVRLYAADALREDSEDSI